MAYFSRNNLYKASVRPSIPFQVDQQKSPPNYDDSSAWAKRPQTLSHEVAVFFIHPTTYQNGSMGWNNDIGEAQSRKILEEIVIPNHAKPFAFNGNLWIPRYRQASISAMLATNDDTREALNLAYLDVATAFDNFIKSIGTENKFIIVGIDQGGLHAQRLIIEKIANSAIENRMVVAYLLNQAVPKSDFIPQNYGNIKICDGAKTINCIFTYRAIDEQNRRYQEIFKARTPIYDKRDGYSILLNRENICTNPLSHGASENADESLNLGSVAANGLEEASMPAFLPNETGAKCQNGILLVDGARSPALKPRLMQLGSLYEIENYNLFFHALSEDAKMRISVAQKK